MKWRPRTRIGNAGAIGGLIGIVFVCLLAITWVVGNLVLLNWGDSADLETGAGTVDKKTAEAFLSAHDADWRTTLETERGIGSGSVQNLPPEARCYFSPALVPTVGVNSRWA